MHNIYIYMSPTAPVLKVILPQPRKVEAFHKVLRKIETEYLPQSMWLTQQWWTKINEWLTFLIRTSRALMEDTKLKKSAALCVGKMFSLVERMSSSGMSILKNFLCSSLRTLLKSKAASQTSSKPKAKAKAKCKAAPRKRPRGQEEQEDDCEEPARKPRRKSRKNKWFQERVWPIEVWIAQFKLLCELLYGILVRMLGTIPVRCISQVEISAFLPRFHSSKSCL